jgi:serine/threonine protein kinase
MRRIGGAGLAVHRRALLGADTNASVARASSALVKRGGATSDGAPSPWRDVIPCASMPPASLAAGTRFGSYTVLRLLGEGGMGAVYEARHERLAKRVALKVLHADIVATNEEAVARFMREGEAASRIRHPNVVDVTDVGVEDGIPFLVMEFLEGESLGAVLEARGALELSEAVDLMLPIASALAAAHEEQIVHRDLKPDNIFLSRTRIGEVVPKLVDFGISKIVSEHDPRLTAADAMIGTPQYMSPEQARGSRSVDARTDQYAFGVILFECVTGQTAVQGDSLLEILHEINSGRISQLDVLRPGVPSGLVEAVARMHARDPGERFPDMVAAGAALLPFASPRAREVWSEHFRVGGTSVAPPSASAEAAESPSSPMGRGAGFTPERTPAPAANTISLPVRSASKRLWIAAAGLLALGGLAVALASRPIPESESPTNVPAVTAPAPAAVAAPEPPPTPERPVPMADAPAVLDAGATPVPEAVAEAVPDAGRIEPSGGEQVAASPAPGVEPEDTKVPRRTPGRPAVKRGANRSIILR